MFTGDIHVSFPGDLAALGNISGLHSLLSTGPLLLPQVPTSALGVPLQGQGALNPLACLINSLQVRLYVGVSVEFVGFSRKR